MDVGKRRHDNEALRFDAKIRALQARIGVCENSNNTGLFS